MKKSISDCDTDKVVCLYKNTIRWMVEEAAQKAHSREPIQKCADNYVFEKEVRKEFNKILRRYLELTDNRGDMESFTI